VIESSQDFLFRVFRAGKKLRFTGIVSVLALQSGVGPDVYRIREDYENAHYARQLRDNRHFGEQILSRVALPLAGRAVAPKMHFSFRRTLRKIVYRPALGLGVHPRATRAWFKGRGKGATIDGLRRIRGLEPLAVAD
jgi:hypothetical protein